MSVVQPRANDRLIIAASRLARSSPQIWDEFLKALGEVSQEKTLACVQAPPDQVIVAQGKAQNITELHALFTDAVNQANRLETKLKERTNGR